MRNTPLRFAATASESVYTSVPAALSTPCSVAALFPRARAPVGYDKRHVPERTVKKCSQSVCIRAVFYVMCRMRLVQQPSLVPCTSWVRLCLQLSIMSLRGTHAASFPHVVLGNTYMMALLRHANECGWFKIYSCLSYRGVTEASVMHGASRNLFIIFN